MPVLVVGWSTHGRRMALLHMLVRPQPPPMVAARAPAGIVRTLVEGVARFCPRAWLAIISNPVNSTVPIAAEVRRGCMAGRLRCFAYVRCYSPCCKVANHSAGWLWACIVQHQGRLHRPPALPLSRPSPAINAGAQARRRLQPQPPVWRDHSGRAACQHLCGGGAGPGPRGRQCARHWRPCRWVVELVGL